LALSAKPRIKEAAEGIPSLPRRSTLIFFSRGVGDRFFDLVMQVQRAIPGLE
jgi:hypothetical protein